MARTSSVKVKELREALELSQAQFADKLHYKQAQVSKVESGAAFASEDFAAGLDRVAGTPGVYARHGGSARTGGADVPC
ncbi:MULTISPECIES: helix-turn-helix transcriptional regulator [Streptomyces]|uniref:helix-turn-helix domain-containing protein n=1 Tax=Streptomyces TaxID=1883 RepID=UPI001D037FAB|nr:MULTISPECIES: helix-turn-helix transcriptional regulator [Streptomyces]MCQ9706382.1 helix-turn-helix transcriptional regulator [Streptomyces sp. BSP1]MCR0990367.1 helix-turn-helix transcriptional regulator [Streptomyces albidoflavus]UDF11181.1 helix-turn-helix transcriptional regulator [Streptomyces sp. WA1-19]